jgi:hypothetical protein
MNGEVQAIDGILGMPPLEINQAQVMVRLDAVVLEFDRPREAALRIRIFAAQALPHALRAQLGRSCAMPAVGGGARRVFRIRRSRLPSELRQESPQHREDNSDLRYR